MKYNFTATFEEILALEVEADSLEEAKAIVSAKLEDGTFSDDCECVDQGPLELRDEIQKFNEQTRDWEYVIQ
jgi:hypothetical protein